MSVTKYLLLRILDNPSAFEGDLLEESWEAIEDARQGRMGHLWSDYRKLLDMNDDNDRFYRFGKYLKKPIYRYAIIRCTLEACE